MSEWKDVKKQSEFKDGSRVIIKYGRFDIIVFNVEGSFYAIEDVCTHDGGILSEGDLDGCEIICPRHGAQFDIRTGKVTVSPAEEDIKSYPTRIFNGMVQIEV